MELRAGQFALRELTVADWPIEQALSHDPDVVRWTHYPPDLDEAQTKRRIEAYLVRAAEGLLQRFVILDGARALGTCGAARLQGETPEVFYALDRSARGRGAAAQAVQALCAWLAECGFDEVALETVEGNLESERVAQRCEFQVASTRSDDHRGEPVTLHRWTWKVPAWPAGG